MARFEIACAQVDELAKLIEVLISKSGTLLASYLTYYVVDYLYCWWAANKLSGTVDKNVLP